MKFKFSKVQRLLFSTSAQPSLLSYAELNANCYCSGEAAIINLCKQKNFEDAISVFYSLESKTLGRSTYANLFVACAQLKSIHHGRLVHRHLFSSNVIPDVILHNHILIMYGKCGAMDDASQLFDTMRERNVVSWTSMISGYSQSNRETEAVELYRGMLQKGLVPDDFSLGSLIRSSSGLFDGELGMQVHSHVIKLGYGSDVTVLNALVTMYSKTERISDAFVVFQRNTEKDLISWGSMIAGFAQQGHEFEALHLFGEMIGAGVHRPNEFHFGSAFSACGNLNLLKYGEQIHSLCTKFGLEKNSFAGCSLSGMYSRCGNLNCARKSFYLLEEPDLVSWNSVIGAFSSGGFADEAIHLFSEMRLSGLEPDDITIQCLLSACTIPQSLFQGQLIHAYLFKMSFCRSTAAFNALLNMYAKCSDLNTAMNLFEEMNKTRNSVSWNTILTACLQHQQPREIFRLSALMRSSNFEFDNITLNSILSAAADLACLDMGNQAHCVALRTGFVDSLMVRNGLINMYAKCGNLSLAGKLFELTGSHCDVFSWSSLIVGYAQFGHGRESLELFKRMQNSGIQPNHVTFVGVLTACSHIGLVDEGLYYYDMMSTIYAIRPTREHCSCMVDLLARAGRLSEAESFINEMPIEPDVIMWKTLLAACKVQNNVDIGRRAAESVLCIDPYNSAAYVLLCGIYATSGRWDDLAELRRLMKSYGVKKSAGKSWIEVRGEMSGFIVEDRRHRRAEDIYGMLEVLDFDMRLYNKNMLD
ncbi:pentatricopeptide repeat-containing protein At3g53360, mitochondrial [Phalaenopsis equestris]|uniref:pentatricopeptide repeat-containing protein At3g53360, mitochondrial n=1 Tax=Phalaenopsis equestris TaxID=78828 RepID=UPI0009E2C327|nr:pentatricopeptide repeat-containing protein At3g53360, mitochondrial [Phalaenopsis equestris]